jgi:hypothetical protein
MGGGGEADRASADHGDGKIGILHGATPSVVPEWWKFW